MKKLFILFLCGLLCAGTIIAQSGEPFSWEIIEDVLYLHGKGAMPDYEARFESGLAHSSDAPWFEVQNTFTRVVIDAGITNIGDNSFFLCSNIVSVSVPSTVTSIGIGAFAGCINLFSIEIPTSVTHIGIEAFYSCIALSSIIIPNSVTHIGDAAFSDCFGLNSVAVSASVESIGGCTFANCDNLSTFINIGSSPQYFDPGCFVFSFTILETCMLWVPAGSVDTYKNTPGWEMFENIEPLWVGLAISEDELSLLPDETKTITAIISGYITDPTVVIWTSDDPSVATVDNTGTVTAISQGQAVITASIGEIEATCLVTVNDNITAEPFDWSIINGVLIISGNGAMPDYDEEADVPWYYLKDEIIGVNLGVITTIGSWSFSNCPNLTSMVIPVSVTSVSHHAFSGSGLTSVVIPGSVTSIGDYAFAGCNKLSEIVNACRKPQTIPVDVFEGIHFESCKLWVPVASVDLYRNAAGWEEFDHNISAGVTIDKEKFYLLPEDFNEIEVIVHTDLIFANNTVFIWSHTIPNVVSTDGTRSASRRVTAVNPGTTDINVFVGGVMGATCTVTVIEKGTSSIEGTVTADMPETVTVNLYINEELITSQTKGKIVGGYVLLATTVPNSNGQYIFDDLPEGSYQIQLVIDNYEPEATKEMTLSENETVTDVDFTVDPDLGIIIDVPTAAKEIFMPVLKIYPNPFTDAVHVTGAEHAASLRVINAAGAVVHTQIITGPDATVHLGHLPAGMYIIRMEYGDRATAVKVVKQ